MLKLALASAIAMALVATPSFAQKGRAPNTSTGDPNERICENITPVGSRIATKRFCGTRAEWEDRKRQDREALESAQKGPCMITRTTGTGRPAC